MGNRMRLHQSVRPQHSARAPALAANARPAPTAIRPPLVRLQQSIGNQAVDRLVQARLKVGAHLDPGITAGPASGNAPPIVHEVLRSPGQPLDAGTRAYFESRYGHDFSRVRVHADSTAAQSAEALGAQAYTVGQHVVFSGHRPSPTAFAGRQLWAHELAHVVQQSRGGQTPDVTPSAPHEQDARAAAMGVAMGLPSVRIACQTGIGIARQPRSIAEIDRDMAAVRARLQELAVVGGDLAMDTGREVKRRAGGVQPAGTHGVPRRQVSRRDVTAGLRGLAQGTGPRAEAARDLLREIADLQDQLGPLQSERGSARSKRARESRRRRQAWMAYDQPGGKKSSATKADVEPKPAKIARPVASPQPQVTPAKVTRSPAMGTAAKVESAVASAVATEGKAATRLSRVGSGLAKLGSVGFHLLLPGPLDALMLMAQFAGSYAEAHEAIRSRNTRIGFAIGLSANLLNRSFGAVRKHLSRKFVLDREVHTQVLGAVGMAERSHNAGLSAGFRYGELLSDDARYALTDVGLSALAAQGRLPESRDALFAAEGVWRLAGALLPTVDRIFEAMRVQAEAERRAKQAQEARERYERGESGAGMRFE